LPGSNFLLGDPLSARHEKLAQLLDIAHLLDVVPKMRPRLKMRGVPTHTLPDRIQGVAVVLMAAQFVEMFDDDGDALGPRRRAGVVARREQGRRSV